VKFREIQGAAVFKRRGDLEIAFVWSGKHTRLACWLWRLAATIFPTIPNRFTIANTQAACIAPPQSLMLNEQHED
jgi:hypothetical protein